MAKPKAKPVRVSVFLDPALDKKVEQRSRQYGWSKSKFVANAIEIYLAPEKKKAA
jgi:metal-responsive CopG/Arc/MetJ family transcriptional regulator